MASLIAIVGAPGTGKTTSLFPIKGLDHIGLDPKETIIINVGNKPLPVRNANALYPSDKLSKGGTNINESNPAQVALIINHIDTRPQYAHIKHIIVDDAQYFQLFQFMDTVRDKGFEKFNLIGEAGYIPIKAAKDCERKDLHIIFTYHVEVDGNGNEKIKTAGKLVEAYMSPEGLFTFVLYTSVTMTNEGKMEYKFRTQNSGSNTGKSPYDCFEDEYIPNDLGLVIQKINEFYG